MLHAMTSGDPFRDSWTSYNAQFFHPNYNFPVFQNPLSYPFFPTGGTLYGPGLFNRPFVEQTENRRTITFGASSTGHLYFPPPYPYNMQVPSIGNPFVGRGFTGVGLESRHLFGSGSIGFDVGSGRSQSSGSFITAEATPTNPYGSEPSDGTPVDIRKRKRDATAASSRSDVMTAGTNSIRNEAAESGSGAIDLSIGSRIKRQRLESCLSESDSAAPLPKADNDDVENARGYVYGHSSSGGFNIPGTSCSSVGNQERPIVQTELLPVKNESWEMSRPQPPRTPFVPQTSLAPTEIFQRGLNLLPGSNIWSPTVGETNASPFAPDILNIPFNPYFPPLLPSPSVGLDWWMERPFDPYQSGTSGNSSSFDFSNPLGIKREEVPATAASSSGPAAARGEETLVCSTQLPSTSIDPEKGPKADGYPPIGGSDTEKPDTETTIKIEDIIITRPTEVPKAMDTPRPQIMRNWLLENLERGLKREAVFRIRKRGHVDIRGLELLSRGIEKIERHSGKGRLTGLGLLCALAEERMKDDIGLSDRDSWEDNSIETEISESEEMTAEIDVEQSDRKRDNSYYTLTTDENLYVEVKSPDSDPPVLIKADEVPVWNSEDTNRPPTLSPNADEQESKERSENENSVISARPVEGSEEKRLNEDDNGGVQAGCSYRKINSPLCSSPDEVKEKKKKKQRRREREEDCSSYSFRPIDPQGSWIKEEKQGDDENSLEKVSSFEIVKTEGSDSSGESPSFQCWKKEESEPGCSGENASEISTKQNKRHGKLILRLRRERLKTPESEESRPKSCVLTTERLMTSKFPVKILTVEDGLFYTAQLSAITPPDVYGITVDGERGNRPHIHSREEILSNSFLDVKPGSKKDLPPGTRVCAYWSGQCRCLYPGSVSASAIIDPDPDSVNIEFDDGDSCRISIDDIRLLPEGYPVTECIQNPLMNLSKKRRSNSKEDSSKRDSANEASTSNVNLTKKKKNRYDSDCGKHKKKHKHRHHRKRRRQDEKRKKRKRKGTKGVSRGKCQRSGSVLARKPWGWSGKGFRRPGIKGKARKEYYRAIQRGNERIVIGECAVFLSTGRPDRPFIGRIESMWETWGANMVVRVKWFYHPEETVGCPATLEYPGALFESPHSDENDVQTISHKCEVLPLKHYIEKLGKSARNHDGSTKLYYLAGFYDPTNTSLQFQEGVK